MPKIAVATDDGSNLGETLDSPMAFIVYDVTDKEILSAQMKFFDENVMEVINDCSVAIAKGCSEQLKATLDSKGISTIISDQLMPDSAIAKFLNIEKGSIGGANYECKH
ncbi:MAG: NifB/NifX family molybdenum-iron cluster-binding protein [Nitrospiria bacterium]